MMHERKAAGVAARSTLTGYERAHAYNVRHQRRDPAPRSTRRLDGMEGRSSGAERCVVTGVQFAGPAPQRSAGDLSSGLRFENGAVSLPI